jgi:ABC-2 type transport system ATP-binding protein
LLGPNGAGKTTTMRVLTGYMPPTEGKALVAGYDVTEQPIDAKRRTGYLPETPPLYPDMTVSEYLTFCARIKGVARADRKARVATAMERTRVADMAKRHCGKLSKGYKQRVGLAQAIVHEPPVLILDEPTSGLDPNQIVEVRKLIERLGQEHTVVLSTHYLQEVEKSCTRVIIVNQGEIVADGTRNELVARHPAGSLRARVRGPEANVVAQLKELLPHGTPITATAQPGGAIEYRIDLASSTAPIDEAVARLVVKNGWDLLELQRDRATLEDVFRSLTLQAQQEALHA